ncbi:hypothetical protein [Caudoviricetes sp.]|nr:hypothetical protein [Caudoviricetes sp.]
MAVLFWCCGIHRLSVNTHSRTRYIFGHTVTVVAKHTQALAHTPTLHIVLLVSVIIV